MTTKLRISKTLALPLSFVTSTIAILGQKRTGKSYKASILAEELLAAGQQVVIVDPTSAWWGLRSSADGKRPGFPITIFGGEHADVPLESTAGEVIADALVRERFSAILDLSLFTKGEEQRFMAAFLETLYRRNRQAMHLFLDEADVYAPQRPFGEDARTLGACQSIVRRGGIKGIGCTLITQRPQVLNKDVLSQADTLIMLRMSHPKDLGAIEEWIAVHGDPQLAKQLIASLPALDSAHGEAWVWSPSQDIFERLSFRARQTYDSGRTPKPGEKIAAPKTLAPIDLDRLGAAIRDTVERVKAADPKLLKAEIERLKKANATLIAGAETAVQSMLAKPSKREAAAERAAAKARASAQRADAVLVGRLEKLADRLDTIGERWTAAAADWGDAARTIANTIGEVANGIRQRVEPRASTPTNGATRITSRVVERVEGAILDAGTRASAALDSVPVGHGPLGHPLPPGEAKILAAALGKPSGVSLTEIAVLTGYKPTSRRTYVQRLSSAGLVRVHGNLVIATPAGEKAMPGAKALPTGAALREHWLARLPEGERKILEHLIHTYPKGIDVDALEAMTGYKPTSRRTYVQRLSARQLVKTGRGYAIASSVLFDGGN